MSCQNSPYVSLKVSDLVVGTGKYFLDPETNEKRRRIDGENLDRFCRVGEELVAVYHVQIYQPYEKMLYPYSFGGPEDPPKSLSEMNKLNQSFKRIIAWDDNSFEPNPDGVDLGNAPLKVDCRTQNGTDLHHLDEIENGIQDLDPRFCSETGQLSHSEGGEDNTHQEANGGADTSSRVRYPSHGIGQDISLTDSQQFELLNNSDDEGDVNALETVDEIVKEIIQECNPEEAEWRKAGLAEKRRKCIYRNRKKEVQKPRSTLCKRRLQLSRRRDNSFLLFRFCCKRWQCFSTVDPQVSFSFYKKTICLSQETRKGEILRLLNWKTNSIYLDGRPVCTEFLEKGFGISRCLQSSIKGTPAAKSSRLPFRMARETWRKTMKDSIINFVRLLAGQDGQHMPHEIRTNLPFPRRGDVYDCFIEHLSRGDEDGESHEPPTRSYFNSVWRKYIPQVTVRKHNDFTVCARCEWLRPKMVHGFRKRDDKLVFRIKRELRENISAMKAERRSYDERKMLAINHPSHYCSIAVDGADQKIYGLPHFMYSVKTDRGNAIKVKCVGVLEHLKNKRLSLFTLSEEFESGANHVIECIHRVLQKKKVTIKKLPPVLFVQMDNCTRENKNRYMMCYLECLVTAGVFTEVRVSFLAIGHTHSDIDQAFGCVARRVSLVDAVTMDDLLGEMRQSFNPKSTAAEVLRVANFSGLCEETGCLQKISKFSEYRYFRFIRDENNFSDDGVYRTACRVKRYLIDPWTPFGRDSVVGGVFMKYPPDFSRTPNTVTRVPDNVEEIAKRLSSVEGRVENPGKMKTLNDLKNRIYESRSDPFHWNVNNIFERNGDYCPIHEEVEQFCEESDNSEGDEEEAILNCDYGENEFVAVRPSEATAEPFWIARVLNVHKRDQYNRTNKLLVRWFSPRRSRSDVYAASYFPSFKQDGDVPIPYSSILHVNTIMVKFQSLTARKKLYVDTQRSIRDCFNNM